MEILLILGSIGSACGIFSAIDLFLKWRKRPIENYQSQLSEANSENQTQTMLTEVIDDAKLQISERLYRLLELLNQNRNNKITISELAEFCGYKKTGDLEKYFLGLEEPNNQEKEHICFCIGVHPLWLKHGKGQPFTSQEPYELYAESYLETIKSKSPVEIIFVRNRDEEGSAVIVLRLNELKYTLLPKTWNISDYVGTTGQGQIYSFYKLIKALHELKATSYKHEHIHMKGNHVNKQDFDNLICGRIYPESVIKPYNDTWWDDLTDINHSWACSPSYEDEHGTNFIKAQEIIKYLMEK